MASTPLGSVPLLFQTCVLPRFRRMRAWAHNSSSAATCNLSTLVGRHCVNIVQISEHVLTNSHPRLYGCQCPVLSEGEQHRHEGIALLPSLPLWNSLSNTHLVFPQICGWAAVEASQGEDLISILREIRSCAPTPSIDITVASGSVSVRVCRT